MKDIPHLAEYEDLRPAGEDKETGTTARYLALDRESHSPTVVTLLESPQADDPSARQRFLRTAEAASRVSQSSLAAITRVGEEDGQCFYAREFVEGETLEERVRRDGPLEEREVLEIGLQAAQALAALARRGLVHGRIEPSNLVLTSSGTLKILDFEVVRPEATDETDAAAFELLTARLKYASPEQLTGQPVEIASDVYCLGVTMWFLLSGRPPFRGAPCAIVGMHLHQSPPVDELGQIDPTLVTLLTRMLDKDPQQRLGDPRQLVAQIRKCLEENGPNQATAFLAGPPDRATARVAVPEPKRFLFAESVIGALIAGAIYYVLSLPMPDEHQVAKGKPAEHSDMVPTAAAVIPGK